MLKNITSPEEQSPAKVSFSLDPASKLKNTGQMIVSSSSGCVHQCRRISQALGVSSIYQPFSSDSAERASEHSHAGQILGAWRAGGCRASMEHSVSVDSLCFIGSKAKSEQAL